MPVDAYEWLERHKISSTAWLVEDLENKIQEISYHAIENRGRHFLDISFEEFNSYLNRNTSTQTPYDLKNYAQYAYEYIDVAIGFKVIDDIFKNHRFSISDEHSVSNNAAELKLFYSKIEERFLVIKPLANMIASITDITNLYIGFITGHESQDRVIDLIRSFMDTYQRQWDLYGVEGYFKS